MKRVLALALLAFGGLCAAQTTTTPILQPHQTFVDNSGLPCAGCSLYSYVAGTTTPQPTYTDSSGTSQNTNPIILDAAGGANIWLKATDTYKFALVNAVGTPVWTVDNVKSTGGGALPCLNAYAVQIANSATNALTCDSTITIDPNSHSLNVGGAITGATFTLRNLATISNSWTLDVTSPATALSSLAPIPLADMATQSADTVLMNATGDAAGPTAVAMPSGCTMGVNYNTATHTWSCAATTIPLSSLATQSADSVVMNATGGAAVPTAVTLPSGCTNGVNYDTSSHTWSCAASTSWTCTGTTAPFGCYRVDTDGTVEEYGKISVPPSGSATNSATITFPHNFTANPVVTFNTVGQASYTGDPNFPPCAQTQTESTSGATVFMLRCITASAGGGNFDNTITLDWKAIGK